MKKILIISGVVIAVVIALGVAGFAYAQSQLPPTPSYPFGTGMMGRFGGRGGMMGGGRSADGTYGPLHPYMIDAVAEAFDMTPEEIQAAHDEGKTMWDIVQEKGLTEEEFSQLMVDARTKALEQAVADGAITQAQADWMLQHMQEMWEYGGGYGPCGGYGGSGRGPGGRWNTPPQVPES